VPTLVVVVSDEGDATSWSTNLPPGSELSACIQQNEDDPNFGECDCRLGWWFDFFAGIGQQVTFVTVGPTYQLGSDELLLCDGSAASYPGPCNPFGSSVCGLDFYQQIACRTGGRFFPVEQTRVIDEPATCELADFQGVADELRDLLIGVGE
jgi:hypothetical protein